MPSLGDIGARETLSPHYYDRAFPAARNGDVGALSSLRPAMQCRSRLTFEQPAASRIIPITGGSPNALATLVKDGSPVPFVFIFDNSGNLTLYDYDYGHYELHESRNTSNKAWAIDIVRGSPDTITVTPLTGGGSAAAVTRAFGFLATG